MLIELSFQTFIFINSLLTNISLDAFIPIVNFTFLIGVVTLIINRCYIRVTRSPRKDFFNISSHEQYTPFVYILIPEYLSI